MGQRKSRTAPDATGVQPPIPRDRRLDIGKVLKPWGIQGKVKALMYAESEDTFQQHPALWAETDAGFVPLSLESAKPHKKALLLKFKDRNRIEEVEDLIGSTLFMDKDSLPPLEEGEYYWHELIGVEVETESGRPLGRIEQILVTGGNDVYVVNDGRREVLLPAIRDVVRKVDVDAEKMVVRPPEGLLKEDDL